VNEYLQTTVDHIYAGGDGIGGYMLTPVASYEETAGFVKILSENESGRIISAHIVGPHADDLIHEIAIAMKGKLTLKDLAEIISIHPSISEAVVGTAISGTKGHQDSCCG
jgi:pyruvate/2-oxoglutarate dehydrogenase complex dihydrolipoamide dehydrogenase (E3) component